MSEMRERSDGMRSFEKLREELAARLEALAKRQQKLDRDLRRLADPDSQERAQEAENDEVLVDLELQGREEIARVRAALERIESGTFGTCDRCGEEITDARLEALPETGLCIDCAV